MIFLYSLNDISDDEHQRPASYPTGPVYKRFSEVYGRLNMAYKDPDPTMRPHKKWKIKKGKAIGKCYLIITNCNPTSKYKYGSVIALQQ
jgi:hypothetical protein